METSIRYVRLRGQTVKPVLCFRGRNQAHVVMNETIVRVVSNIPLEDHDKAGIVMGPSGYGKTEYPIKLFCERMERIGAVRGITKRAQFMLEKAKNGGVEDDAVLPPDDPVSPLDPGRLRTVEDAPTLGEIAARKSEPVRRATNAPAARRPVGGIAPASGAARKPDKPVRSSSGSRSAPVAGTRTAGADIVRKLAAELNLEPTKLRKLLRSKGLSAPYTDEKLIRSKLK